MYSFAIGIGTRNSKGDWLEVYFPQPVFRPSADFMDEVAPVLGYAGGNINIDLDDAALAKLADAISDDAQSALARACIGGSKPVVATLLEGDNALTSTPEAYLKLHLLSHRYVVPNEQNLEGIYALLPNVAWTNLGAMEIEDVTLAQIEARKRGEVLEVQAIDKFPKMTNYVTPSGVRIAHSGRVRLGAYLGEGTTVMHEGFVNFNAGANGPNMIEGRVSQGVMVDSGSDLGGSASTAGTLSGGGNLVITIGKDCLISANAGTGISLGDRCTIEAGLYITPGTVVQVLDEHKSLVHEVKARELSGGSDMLFIRNSQTGVVECRSNARAISLNDALHAHN